MTACSIRLRCGLAKYIAEWDKLELVRSKHRLGAVWVCKCMKRFQGTVSEEKEPQSLVKRFVVVSCAVEQVWKRLNEYDRVQGTLHVFPVRARTGILYIYTYPEWNGFPTADEKFLVVPIFLKHLTKM